MAKEQRDEWLVGIAHSDLGEAIVYRAKGTSSQIKKYLASLVRKARDNDKDSFDSGITKAADVENPSNGEYHSYANFSDYHIVFSAYLDDGVFEELK